MFFGSFRQQMLPEQGKTLWSLCYFVLPPGAEEFQYHSGSIFVLTWMWFNQPPQKPQSLLNPSRKYPVSFWAAQWRNLKKDMLSQITCWNQVSFCSLTVSQPWSNPRRHFAIIFFPQLTGKTRILLLKLCLPVSPNHRKGSQERNNGSSDPG